MQQSAVELEACSSGLNGAANAVPAAARPSSDEPEPLDLLPGQIPQHVAVIMDGNRRWAADRNRDAAYGHERGVHSLRSAVRCCLAWGIPHLTAYAFSTENWHRGPREVAFLLSLIEHVIQREVDAMVATGVRLRFLGNTRALPLSLQQRITKAEHQTGRNSKVTLTIAINYSGRQDLTAAVARIARLAAESKLHPSEVTEDLVASHLSTSSGPGCASRDPDLLIRTSGEQRLSNFLLWEAAYAELYFTDVCWPDFGEHEFRVAVHAYARRDRRFGMR
ncbi:hypothetical protein WJX72_011806 [[Myrmecia] bisecta]|uniref:Alkyl transferase n=1 Tax=[Myrmecia] bisecta TaxID=41462 RepID=A0AAW1QBG3_9CHLO